MQSERCGKMAVGGRVGARTCAGGGTTVPRRLIAGFRIPAMAVAGIALLVLSCGDGAVEPPPPPVPVATAVSVNPGSAALSALGATARFTAEVRDQNGQVMGGAAVAWASSDASVATVDASGVATAAANGSATITATAGSVSGTAAVTVAQVVSAVAVSPAADTLVAFGDTVRLMAQATDANGHSVEAVTEFSWSSSDTLVARVDETGLVESLAEGAVVVAAAASGVTGGAELSVVPPLPTTVTVSPDTIRFTALAQTAQLEAEVREQAGRVMAEASVSWSSDDTLVVVVDSAGVVTAVGAGTTSVSAVAGDASDAVVVTVTQSAGSVVVSPAEGTIALGDTLRLNAEAFDENGHGVEGSVFSWSSSNAGVARVDDTGLVEGVAEGTARIRATAGDASGVAVVTVENPDRAALVALYEATDGPHWIDNTNWLTDAPLGEWYGVETDGSGRVVELDLSGLWDGDDSRGNGLLGSIPPELRNLANLEELDLGWNALAGRIPPELGQLGNLRRLVLWENGLQGHIPPELGSLGDLRTLILSGNRLTGTIPPELGELAKLGGLLLHRNRLEGAIPPELGNLTELTSLRIAENELEGAIPSQLGSLTNLSTLSASNNNLTGPIPPELGNLAKLRKLWLHNNQLTGRIPSWLADSEQLRVLSLGTNQLTGPIPPWLGNLTELESLSLGGNLLTGRVPPDLGNLVNLTSLTVDGNPLTGSIPQSFLNLDKLRSLGCRRTEGVCLPATVEFKEWLQDVEARGRGNFPVDILFCDEVDKRALATLYEVANGPDWIRSNGWPNGEDLDRWHGVSTGSDGRVSGLDLTANELSGRLPEALGQLTSLTELRIADNALTGRLPVSLANTSMEVLDYSGTSLCVADDPGYRTWLNGVARVTGAGVPCPPLTEREILETVYGSTDGGNWTESKGWLTGAPLDEWHGVDTDQTGRVVALRLADNRLSGTVPAELGQLSALTTLELRGNRLHDRIPLALGGLEDLRVLDLSANYQLSGAIPDELGQLAELEYLNLSRNQLSGRIPSALGDLPHLQSLFLSHNRLGGRIPEQLGNLNDLANLHLGDNRLSGPIPPAIAKGLAGLESLDLSNNRLEGEIPGELGERRSLRRLSASENRLSGHIPPQLAALDRLEYLSLSKNELTGPIPSELGTVAQDLIHLDLADNQITGPLPQGLGRATRLRVLDLRSNGLSGPIPPEYSRLTGLRSLIVAENPELSGPLPAGFTALGQLERLLAGNTGLCLPMDPRFDDWFGGMASRRLTPCLAGPAVSLTQTVQSWDDPVPLVAGERALLRVFVTAPQGENVTMPDVRATFYVNGAERHAVRIDAGSASLPSSIVQDDLSRSANAEIPGDVIAPGLQMVVEVDPEGTLDPALGITKRIPDSGTLDVDVRSVPGFDLTLVPLLGEGEDSSVVKLIGEVAADPHGHELLGDVRTLLPLGDLAVTAHAPVYAADPNPHRLLAQVEAIRLLEGGGGHWMGLFTLQLHTVGTTRRLWPGGVAYTPGRTSVSLARPYYMVHELGHNLGLGHAPCGDAGGPDPFFPSTAARIGSWGYDFRRTALVAPTAYDLMSYCRDPYWVSDYHFNKALKHRLAEGGATAAPAAAANPVRALLVWGGRDEDGAPYLDPAFVVDAAPSLPDVAGGYTIDGVAADGARLFSYAFEMPVNEDAEGRETSFVFTLPVQTEWAGRLARITLSGPEGSATLDESTNRPMAILRDPRTGQVRGFLSDPPAATQVASDAAAGVAGPGLDVLFSLGLPNLEARRR